MRDFVELANKVVDLVKRAAAIAKDNTFTVKIKGTAENIVTSADLAIQKYLKENLKKLLPDCGFLCEENGLLDLSHENIWIIDPIDGTTNFSKGIKNCAISVALATNGTPVLGVVYNIFNDDIFTATAGGGARLNGLRINVSGKPFNDCLFCTAMSLYKKDYAKACSEIIYDTYMQCNDIRRFGSCALELCYIAAGMCELYFEIRVFPWDYAAGYLILQEAGGILKGFNGESLLFDKPTPLIGANSLENFEKLNAIVIKHMKNVPYKETL